MNNTVILVVIAVVAFLLVFTLFYFNSVRDFFNKMFTRKKNTKPSDKKGSENIPQKKEKVTYTVEDFKPIASAEVEQKRDSSLDNLFNDETDEIIDQFDNNYNFDDNTFGKDESDMNDEEFEKMMNSFKEDSFDYDDNKTLAQKIQELPPELKVLIVDNVLSRKEEVDNRIENSDDENNDDK